MRPVLALAAAFALAAHGASAQPTTSAAATAAPTTPAAAKSDTTVSGVTVKPLPRKQCSPKDKDCIAMVMAELKDLYPEQLKKFCYQEKMNVMRQDMQANVNGWCGNPFRGSAALCHHEVSPVIKQVCTSGPTADRADVKK
jgi:hypothetical protein